jgi:hypothetical protein
MATSYFLMGRKFALCIFHLLRIDLQFSLLLCLTKLKHDESMFELWSYGAMELWSYGAMELWRLVVSLGI